jgi:hypothetical protein
VLPFFLKTPVEGEFKEVDLQLRTTGGACNTLEEALDRFFGDCGWRSSGARAAGARLWARRR